MSWQIFVSSVVFGLKISKLSSSVSICSVHKTSHKGFHLQFLGFIWNHLKILEAPSFATKENFCLSSRLISVQLHGGHSFYNKWSINLSQFCLFSWSYPVFWDNFVSGVFEDLSTSAKICQVTTNHPHLWNVGDDRKFVIINNFVQPLSNSSLPSFPKHSFILSYIHVVMIQLEYSLVFQMELQVVMDIYIIYFAIRKKGGLTDGVLNSLVRYVMKYLIGKSHHLNPSTLKISLGIFLTIFHTILIKLVWGIW